MPTKFIKKENLVVVEEYKKDGVTKKSYKTIGELLTFETDGKAWQKEKLYMFPNLNISIYEDRKKEESNTGTAEKIPVIQQEEEITSKDIIPF